MNGIFVSVGELNFRGSWNFCKYGDLNFSKRWHIGKFFGTSILVEDRILVNFDKLKFCAIS